MLPPAAVLPKLEGEPLRGPLKTLRFRLAKTGKLGEPGARLLKVFLLGSANVGRLPSAPGGGRLLTRTPDGKVPFVGVAGRTLTEVCGDRASREPEADDKPDGEATELLLVLEALL